MAWADAPVKACAPGNRVRAQKGCLQNILGALPNIIIHPTRFNVDIIRK
jgi:hypothetical protein